MFESDVIPDSGKTQDPHSIIYLPFESDVIPDSGKTQEEINKLSNAV